VATGATYFASGLQEFVSYGLGGLLSLLGIIAGLLWFGSFVSFYTTSTSFSDLKRRIRKKDHSSGSS
jgi:hypothetical protein